MSKNIWASNARPKKGEFKMQNAVSLMAVTHTHTHTHTQYNLINKKIKHKGMMYLCIFEMFKII